MRALLILVLLPLSSTQAVIRHSAIDIEAGELTERACYFEGKRYSEGTLLQDDGGTMRCGVLDGVTDNGSLGWLREGEEGKAVIERRQDDKDRVIEIRK